MAAILSDRDITLEREAGNLVIEPFHPQNLAPCSYDVCLGDWFYSPAADLEMGFVCIDNPKQIVSYWCDLYSESRDDNEKLTYGAQRAHQVTTQEEADRYGVSIGDRIIILQPGRMILAHTQEFIGGRNSITTMIKARSSTGRMGVTISGDAGWGDVGYFNRWTLEIVSNAQVPVVLKVGARIGQIVFLRTGPTNVAYNSTGQYQSSDSVESLVQNWSPLLMLPGAAQRLLKGVI